MKMLKLSSILILTLFFLSAFIPEASAKRCRSSFGLRVNVGGPNYVVAPAPAPVVAAPAPVYPAYVAPAPYPYYYAPAPAPVVVESPGVYVQPGFSYSYWRRY